MARIASEEGLDGWLLLGGPAFDFIFLEDLVQDALNFVKVGVDVFYTCCVNTGSSAPTLDQRPYFSNLLL